MQILVDYRGREVRLTDERLAHILGHPEMRGLEPALAETLRAPTWVFASSSDRDAALHYRFYTRTLAGDKWLCVVVKHSGLDAFVLTGYLTDKIKKGTQLWPKS